MRIGKWIALVVVALAGASTLSEMLLAAEVTPLAQAHAHNDYLHTKPLLDALAHGFNSVEADIFLVDGQLLVAHTKNEIKPERTLQKLYLDPLRERVKANGGAVFAGGKPFGLLIDLKTAGGPTYAALDKVLADYADMISSVEDGKFTQKAVNVVISGDRPIDVLAAQKLRYAGVDGRWSDLDSNQPVDLMPLISDNWNVHFKWRGKGPLPDGEREKLTSAVAKAHAHGRKIRLWATPDRPEAWRELQAAGVDLINTDLLIGLEEFLRANPSESKPAK